MDCKKILVPIDGSENSLQAAAEAIEIAGAYHAEIEYLYVVDLEGALAHRDSSHGSSVLEDAVEAGKRVLNGALEATPSEVQARGRCISGSAAKAILRIAKEDAADMIVGQSRTGGYSGSDSWQCEQLCTGACKMSSYFGKG